MTIHPKFTELLLPLVISASLAGCGGGGGGSDDSGADDGGSSTAISGSASKGIVLGGVVNAYLITDTGEKGELVAGPVTTSTEDGTYELTLDGDYDGSALLIEITGADDGSTEMKCDLAVCQRDGEGNPTVEFGGTYSLPSSFSLSAVSPGTSESSIAINITALTNVAAALTLDKVSNGATAADAALATNVQVASRFGISGDLTEQPIVDITDADSINAADTDALEYNLKAAAVVQAALVSDAEATVEDALESFVSQYVETGVADTDSGTDDPGVVTLEEILEQAAGLVDEVRELEGVDGETDALMAVESGIDAEEADAETNGSTDADQGDIPDDIGSTGLIASKAFVQQLRDFVNTTLVNGGDNLSVFSEQIQLAKEATSADTEIALEGLALAMEAITYAWEASQEETLSTYEYEGITVSISGGAYSVDQSLVVEGVDVEVDLTATIADFTDNLTSSEVTEAVTTETESGTVSADFSIVGSSATTRVSVSVAEGSEFAAGLEVDYTGTYDQSDVSYSESFTDAITVTDLDASLTIVIAQQAVGEITDPVTFTGSADFAVDLIDYLEQEEATNTWSPESSYSEVGSDSIEINGLNLTLSGEFSNSSTTFLASASLAASGIVYECEWSYSSEFSENGSVVTDMEICDLAETESTFASAALTLIFDLDMSGMVDDIRVEATVTRTGFDAASADVDITYGGSQLDFDFAYESGDGSVTVTNQTGVVLTLTETEGDDGSSSVSGTVVHDDTTYAEINEDAGVVTVRFNDGEFETL